MTTRMTSNAWWLALTIAMSAGLMVGQPSRPADLAFDGHLIDPGASETVAVADINGDGRLDIVSGESDGRTDIVSASWFANCGETVEPQFTSCWNCEAIRPGRPGSDAGQVSPGCLSGAAKPLRCRPQAA